MRAETAARPGTTMGTTAHKSRPCTGHRYAWNVSTIDGQRTEGTAPKCRPAPVAGEPKTKRIVSRCLPFNL